MATAAFIEKFSVCRILILIACSLTTVEGERWKIENCVAFPIWRKRVLIEFNLEGQQTNGKPSQSNCVLCKELTRLTRHSQVTLQQLRASLSNAKHHLEELHDDPSVLTQDTIFRNMGSVTTAGTKKTANRRSRLCAINKTTGSSSMSHQSFLMSHRTSEPDIPHAAVAPAQDMGSYMKSTSPNLMAVREFVEMCNTAGLDD